MILGKWYSEQRLRLSAAIAVGSLVVVSFGWRCARAQDLTCSTRVLYRGDSLTVELPEDHSGFDFVVAGEALDERAISFRPTSKDTIGPPIAPEEFARMRRVKLVTTTARGPLFRPWVRPGGPIAYGPSELIFTRPGPYEVLLGRDLGDDEADFDACWVDYFDYPNPYPYTVQKPSSSAESGTAGRRCRG